MFQETIIRKVRTFLVFAHKRPDLFFSLGVTQFFEHVRNFRIELFGENWCLGTVADFWIRCLECVVLFLKPVHGGKEKKRCFSRTAFSRQQTARAAYRRKQASCRFEEKIVAVLKNID